MTTIHPTLLAVTERIRARSRDLRADYLARLQALRRRDRGSDRMGCANVAHAVAGVPANDKLRIVAERAPNIGIVTAFNDMLSAHAPFQGYPDIIKHEARRYDVFALRPTRVALMPRRTFEWLRETSIAFNHYLQELLNARLSLFIGALAHERLLDTDARVAHCLASLFNPELYPDAPRHLQVGQTEVGLLANVSRQRVNVALQRLQALGLIRLERRGLTVLDLPGLDGFRAAYGSDPASRETGAARRA